MGKEYIPLFLDFNETTQDLTDEECGRLVRAVVEYAKGNAYEDRLIGAERIAFRFLKGLVDRNAAISEARSRAVSTRYKQIQNSTNAYKPEETPTNVLIDTDTDIDTETDTNICVINKANRKRFTPPTREEVQEYCRERGNNVDVERFVDFYTAKGWMVGKNPMKDWKAAVRTWERSDNQQKPVALLPAQNYQQRDYSGYEDEALERMLQQHAEQFGKKA